MPVKSRCGEFVGGRGAETRGAFVRAVVEVGTWTFIAPICLCVGDAVGAFVGEEVGGAVGETDGLVVGVAVGFFPGSFLP